MASTDEDGSDDIKYEQLQGTQIRLLRLFPSLTDQDQIQCSLESFAIESPPPYIALSYTWGNVGETSEILVDDQIFEGTKNLEDALKYLRVDCSLLFWVDAVCINQKDDNEKKHQLRLMPTIFARARETRVWLGREEDNSNRAIDLINRMAKLQVESCNMSGYKSSAMSFALFRDRADIIALQHLLVRGYWFRVWVVQEIAVSRKVMVSCGGCQIPFEAVLKATEFMLPLERMQLIEATVAQDKSEPLYTIRDGLQRILSIQSVRNDKIEPGDPTERPPDSLLYLLSSHRSTEATEARDKYYALAGLCVEDESILNQTSSAESIQDVYLLAAESTTKEGGHSALDFLDFAGWPTKILSLPSWTPDWSYTRDRAVPLLYWQLAGQKRRKMVVLNAPGRFNGSIPRSFSFRKYGCLLARGFEIDTINGVGFSRWLPEKVMAEIQNPDKSHQYRLDKYILGDESLTDAIWRTCVLNFADDGLKAPEDWGHLFYERILCPGSGWNTDHDNWHDENKNFQIYGIELKNISEARRETYFESQPESTGAKTMMELQLKNAFDIAVRYRRLATTENGYICLAPSSTRCGDLIVVLLDCSVPVVLRRKHEHMEFVGTCYVHGIMQGEAMERLSVQDSVEFEIR